VSEPCLERNRPFFTLGQTFADTVSKVKVRIGAYVRARLMGLKVILKLKW
jgi:hypothetical protein